MVKTYWSSRPNNVLTKVFSVFSISRNSGVSMVNFMRTAINEQRKYRQQEPISATDFYALCEPKEELKMDNKTYQPISERRILGRQKKRNELPNGNARSTACRRNRLRAWHWCAAHCSNNGVNKLKPPPTTPLLSSHITNVCSTT